MNQSLYDHSYGFPRDELRLVPVGPSPGRGGENQEPYDVVMSELVEVLIWIGESLLSSRCSRLDPPSPVVKAPSQVHFTQHPNPQNTPERLPNLLQEPESSPSFLSGNPLGEEGADSRTMLFTSFQMGY